MVNAYDSTSPVKSITAQFFDREKAIGEKNLQRKSHWTWGIDKSEVPQEATKLTVTATFADGQKRDVSTVYGKLAPSISFIEDAGKETWGSAYGNASRTASFGKIDDEHKNLKLNKLWTSNVGNPIFEASPVIENGTIFVATMPDSKFKGAGVRALEGSMLGSGGSAV